MSETPAQRCARALQELEVVLRRNPTPIALALEHARLFGSAAQQAGAEIVQLVEAVAAIVPDHGYKYPEFPRAMMEAVFVGFTRAAEDGRCVRALDAIGRARDGIHCGQAEHGHS